MLKHSFEEHMLLSRRRSRNLRERRMQLFVTPTLSGELHIHLGSPTSPHLHSGKPERLTSETKRRYRDEYTRKRAIKVLELIGFAGKLHSNLHRR